MIINGTTYHKDTPLDLARLLEQARISNKRVRLFYGDTKTGRSWHEENDVCGYLGRSTGAVKIPLLIANSRSTGGPAILDHCIVALMVEGQWKYKHPEFLVPECFISHEALPDGYTVGVDLPNEQGKYIRHANFKTEVQAARWVQFMRGERQTK